MFHEVEPHKVKEVLDYFNRDPKMCLYSLIDLKKYGLSNPNLHIWVERAASEITCVLVRYYDGMNIFSYHNKLDVKSAAQFVAKQAPSMVSGPAATIWLLQCKLEKILGEGAYKYAEGSVTEIHEVKGILTDDDYVVEDAKDEDFPEIARMICADEGLGGTYEPESLAASLKECRDDGFGRNKIIRKDGRIICHADTHAEVDDLAVISGVITAPEYRGQNLANRVVSKLSLELLQEGKLPCLYYYTDSAARLYEKVGFEEAKAWAKLTRQ